MSAIELNMFYCIIYGLKRVEHAVFHIGIGTGDEGFIVFNLYSKYPVITNWNLDVQYTFPLLTCT